MSKFVSATLAAAPGIITGLYAGRVIGEIWAAWTGSTAWWLALLITFACVLIGASVVSRYPLRQSWPLLFLLFYVLYPELSFTAAGLSVLFVFLLWWQANAVSLPLHLPYTRYLAPLLLLIFCFILYMRTLAPDILPADNGEFQLVAANLGVAHPPGFPLYTMLAHLMTRFPFGPTPAYRVNLFSAVTSTLTLAAVYATVYRLTRRNLPSAAAVLALATATTFWAQATTANIRSMTALFTAVIFLTLIHFYHSSLRAAAVEKKKGADHSLIFFAFFMGLGVTHHASLAFLGLISVIFILLVDGSLLRTPGRWWRPALAFLAGLLPLLYLPLRANVDVRGASPALATTAGFLEHVLATGFRGDLFVYLEPALFFERLKIMANVITFQFSPWLVLLMILSLFLVLKQEWRLAFLFAGFALLFTLVTATYRAPQTVEYLLPAYVALALLLGTASGGIVESEKISTGAIWPALRNVLAALVIVLAVHQLLSRYHSYSWLSERYTAREYANELLAQAPDDALILANWHWATPIWYLQEVEGFREEVEVRYVFPESEPYAQTWTRRTSEGLGNGRIVITTNFDNDAFARLPPPEPLGEAFLFSQEPRTGIPDGMIEVDLLLGDTINVLGYSVDREELPLEEALVLTLAWHPVSDLESSTTLFAHLVGADGQLAGLNDVPADAQPEGITLTQLRLAPFAGTQTGQYGVQIGAYDQEPLLASDGSARVPVSAVQFNDAGFAPATEHPLARLLVGEPDRRLAGYDTDTTIVDRARLYLHWRTADGYVSEVYDNQIPLLPQFIGPWGVPSSRWSLLSDGDPASYVPLGQGIVWTGDALDEPLSAGQEVVLDQRFLSTIPVLSDQVVSVRLIGFEDDGFHWAWWDLDDAIPAMGAIPTLKWIAGSQVSSPHFVTVADSAPAGQQLGGALTLYDAFTGRVLPILDSRLAGEFGWIPLGETSVE